MRFFLMICLLISLNGVAEAETAAVVTVNFTEAELDADCTAALNAYQPTLHASATAADLGPPIIIDGAEASGKRPECQFAPGASITLFTNRLAAGIAFNRSGTLFIELLRNGQSVYSDNSSGLGGRFEYNGTMFNQIILTEPTGNAPVLWDELAITFPTHAATTTVDFSENTPHTCLDAINAHPDLHSAPASGSGVPEVIHDANGLDDLWVCEFGPGNVLSVRLTRPAAGIRFDLLGAAQVQFFLNGDAVTPATEVAGMPLHYTLTPGPFNEIILTEASGSSSFAFDNLQITYVLSGTNITVDFSEAEPTCAAAINTHGLIANGDNALIESTSSSRRRAPECMLQPDSELIISLDRPAVALSFAHTGDGTITVFRDGQPVGLADQSVGPPGQFSYVVFGGFDQILIRDCCSLSPFKFDDLQIAFDD